jgi:hypothetical protein
MPNWCSNTLRIEHDDPAQITRAIEGFKKGEFFQTLVPNPSNEWDYDWCVNYWGTKWDVGGDGYDPVVESATAASFSFDSAWAPPCAAYDSLVEQGFRVYAMYYESGMCFAGIYDNGDDDYYEFSGNSSREVADMLPTELDAEFGISETMAEYEDEEPLTEWYVEGAKAKGLIKDD